MAYTPIEQEIIVLRAVWEMIDGMVNYEIFEKGHGTVDAEVRINSATHMRLFNILLVDFLSKPNNRPFNLPEAGGPAKTDRTQLFYLSHICDEPLLNRDSNSIREPLEAFVGWLEGECFVEEVWLPTIEMNANIRVQRITFLKLCGDIAKHNFARLGRVIREVADVLAENEVTVDEAQALLLLPEFYERFHGDVLNYHGSTIAEHLNNLRWGIFNYLTPEFERLFQTTEPMAFNFEFNFPAGCQSPLAKAMYWDLMERVRAEPRFPVFTTSPFQKERY